MPASDPLILISGMLYLLLGFATAQVLGKTIPAAVIASLVDCAFYIVWCAAIVHLMGKPERFKQTLLCIFLIGILAGGFGLALAYPMANSTPETVPGAVLIIGLTSIVWIISLLGRCIAEAVDKPISFGVGATIAYVFINDILIRAIS